MKNLLHLQFQKANSLFKEKFLVFALSANPPENTTVEAIKDGLKLNNSNLEISSDVQDKIVEVKTGISEIITQLKSIKDAASTALQAKIDTYMQQLKDISTKLNNLNEAINSQADLDTFFNNLSQALGVEFQTLNTEISAEQELSGAATALGLDQAAIQNSQLEFGSGSANVEAATELEGAADKVTDSDSIVIRGGTDSQGYDPNTELNDSRMNRFKAEFTELLEQNIFSRIRPDTVIIKIRDNKDKIQKLIAGDSSVIQGEDWLAGDGLLNIALAFQRSKAYFTNVVKGTDDQWKNGKFKIHIALNTSRNAGIGYVDDSGNIFSSTNIAAALNQVGEFVTERYASVQLNPYSLMNKTSAEVNQILDTPEKIEATLAKIRNLTEVSGTVEKNDADKLYGLIKVIKENTNINSQELSTELDQLEATLDSFLNLRIEGLNYLGSLRVRDDVSLDTLDLKNKQTTLHAFGEEITIKINGSNNYSLIMEDGSNYQSSYFSNSPGKTMQAALIVLDAKDTVGNKTSTLQSPFDTSSNALGGGYIDFQFNDSVLSNDLSTNYRTYSLFVGGNSFNNRDAVTILNHWWNTRNTNS